MKFMSMVKVASLVSLTAIALNVQPVAAAQPRFFSVDVHVTTVSNFYSALCGATVTVTLDGTVAGLLFTDQDGTLREIDTPGATRTFSAPSTGLSLTMPPGGTFQYLYTDGAAPGSAVTLYSDGASFKVPGLPADAGRVTYADAVVLFIDPASGFPIVDFGPPTAFAGHFNDPATEIAAGCAALGLAVSP